MPFENQQATFQDTSSRKAVLFFDGVCHLCNSVVDWVIQNETRRTISFAPLQGKTAEAKLPVEDRKNLDTLVVVTEQGEILKRSDAVIFILSRMSGLASALGFFLKLIPRFLRDAGYNFVAKHRYRWFGQRESCRLPTPSEKGLLLP